MASFFSNLITC